MPMLLLINHCRSCLVASIVWSLLLVCLAGSAAAIETRAKAGFVIDYTTGMVLQLVKNMSQMATVVIFITFCRLMTTVVLGRVWT